LIIELKQWSEEVREDNGRTSNIKILFRKTETLYLKICLNYFFLIFQKNSQKNSKIF